MSTLLLHPPWIKAGKRIESLIRKALYTYKMLENHKKIVVALSGGKDSLTLLLMLKAISGRGFPNLDLYAIHVRGKYSCGAEVSQHYLRQICDKIHVPFTTVSSPYNPDTPECYPCSQVRRRLLFQGAKQLGATAIAFGHHRDDLVQTVLINLCHKAEFSGMLPVLDMIHFQVTLLRPLIFTPEFWIRKFAKEHGFARVTCRCPVISLRSKAEAQLKFLEGIFPLARHNIALAICEYGSSKSQKNNS
ncbi:tRNA 2-thiocytidine biosynthesis TtcA family protein [Candidatus Chlamydia sanziniae]|uniref:tRNA Cytosine-2-thiocytidine synthetase n=1 Tax=Candidatus Chlamydia sanziniae TaxID=1806891 RepID=A0A1A9HVJ8_9CHLA|nr:tRNA 2-thiocytidine biosynthesis TtcA family protein [Candidatus Chlamydia sanziniae]ANH79008.1 tRNA Cytosine-2-thiocytidine synthetase [Candidatus Chlamydia sanziniae]